MHRTRTVAGLSAICLSGLFVNFAHPELSAAQKRDPFPAVCKMPDMPERTERTDTVRLMTWNIQQIPGIATQDYPEGREHCQKQVADRFDIVMMQEAFLNTDTIRQDAAWSSRPVFPPGRKPLGFIHSSFRSPGLMALSDRQAQEIEVRPFRSCAGLFNHKNDCLAQKGFQIFKVGDVTFVNVHMDAGGSPADRKVRNLQTAVLFAALPLEGPLVFAGDININDTRPEEYARFMGLAQNAGLTIVRHNKNDIIAVRGVEVADSGLLDLDRYSDHKALWADFNLPPSAPKPPPVQIAKMR